MEFIGQDVDLVWPLKCINTQKPADQKKKNTGSPIQTFEVDALLSGLLHYRNTLISAASEVKIDQQSRVNR